MRLTILAVGRLKPGPERDLLARYATRAAALAPRLGLHGPTVTELDESRARNAPARQREEAAMLRAKAGDAALILLDERGADLTSEAFAARLARLRDDGARGLALVLGGPDGHDPALRAGAAQTLALGRLTLPHGLARIVLAEQVYRALTILSGHPYHRG